jgi:hypothetical protein
MTSKMEANNHARNSIFLPSDAIFLAICKERLDWRVSSRTDEHKGPREEAKFSFKLPSCDSASWGSVF